MLFILWDLWHGGGKNEAELLRSCYTESMRLALKHDCRNIAFPGISTGIYGYPVEEASKIALSTVKDFLKKSGSEIEVIFVCFSDRNKAVFEYLLK